MSKKSRFAASTAYAAFVRWLRDVPIDDPVDRRSAPAMQALFLLFGAGLSVLESARMLAGRPISAGSLVVNFSIAVVALVALVLLRKGHFRASVILFLSAGLVLMALSYSSAGLVAERVNFGAHPLFMILAALMLGRRALWWNCLALAVCILLGAVRDVHKGLYHWHDVWGVMLGAVPNLLIIAVLLDRGVTALQESLAEARARGESLIVANRRLQEETREREELQDRLVHAQKVEAVGRMASGIAHDFNNILGVILGYAQWRTRHPGVDALKRALAGIEAAATRGAAVSRTLLGFSRRDIAQSETFDARVALLALGPMLRQLFGKDVLVNIEVGDEPLPIHMDRGRFDLSVLNIASNARDAMGQHGHFELVARRAHGAHGKDAMEIVLSDDGCGMAPEVLDRIFEPFYTTKPRGHGTGLGLSVVRDVVQLAGGGMEVQSAVAQGTTVRIHLPVVDAVDERDGFADHARRPNVLLVDDDDDLRVLLADVLQRGGFDVVCAADGAEAMRRVEEGMRPDLLVTDNRMPTLRGADLLRLLRGRIPTLPVIITSAYMEDESVVVAEACGNVECLQKPFPPDALLRLARRLNEQESRAARQ